MKKWNVSAPDRSTVSKLMLGCKVTSLTAAALASKGYSSPDSVMSSLQTGELSDPFLIKDMQIAADILNEAVENGDKICVYGDYDCDGVTAAAILCSYLTEIGADVVSYIPERSEGYGLNIAAVDRIAEMGVQLIVTVDNGIAAIAEAEHIYECGMRLVVTDHHQQGETLPRAEAVVDPHRHDDFSPFKYGCGALIALKLCAAMDGGDYTMALEQFGDLAAVATVADIVSLTGENRFIVSYGLNLLNNSDRPAIMALKEVCGINDKTLTSFDIGFGIGPRINASGRFGSPKTALDLLLCEDYDEALALARQLDELNSSRKSSENQIISEIYAMADKDPSLLRGRVIFICGKGWHHGVIGIAASRIMEQFGKPCFIASEDNGEIRGSARSFGDFSVFDALTAASEALSKFGGHPGAGGFTIKPGMTGIFHSLLEDYALREHSVMPVAELTADAVVTSSELTVDNIRGLSVLEPFGMGNTKPQFCIDDAELADVVPLSGGAHSKLVFILGGSRHEALFFRRPPAELPVKKGDRFDMIVTLSVNEFRGTESPSLIISDIRLHGFGQDKYFAALNSFEAFMREEKLPANYYPAMLPERDDVVRLYKAIPDGGINSDALYLRLADSRMNYCRFCVAAEALRELGLVGITSSDQRITKLPVTKKADLDAAPVLARLRAARS